MQQIATHLSFHTLCPHRLRVSQASTLETSLRPAHTQSIYHFQARPKMQHSGNDEIVPEVIYVRNSLAQDR